LLLARRSSKSWMPTPGWHARPFRLPWRSRLRLCGQTWSIRLSRQWR